LARDFGFAAAFGLAVLVFFAGAGAASAFGAGSGAPARFCAAIVFMRAMSPDDPHARRVLELTGGPLKAQIELLFLQLEYLVIELVDRHRSYVGNFHDITRRYVR